MFHFHFFSQIYKEERSVYHLVLYTKYCEIFVFLFLSFSAFYSLLEDIPFELHFQQYEMTTQIC